ncbi:MAG: TlpA disulfide reductase family protein [Saprospiraceae bacterium]
MKKIYYLFLLHFLFLSACIEPKAGYDFLAPGIWRGVLHLNPEPKPTLKDEIKRYEKEGTHPIYNVEDELPFFFEVKYAEGKKQPYLEIINGPERIRIDDVFMGRNRTTAEDTVMIDFAVFDSHLRGIAREGIIEGEWVVRNKVNYRIPFTAHFGQKDQFNVLPVSPTGDLTGFWACKFDLNETVPYDAVGEFTQKGSELNGTFRTETGDYRYLHGTVAGDRFYMSCFDGSHAYLFYGKFNGDSIIGSFQSGRSAVSLWEGVKNDKATLKSALSLNKPTKIPVQFNFLDSEGKIKSLKDYTGTVKILQVMGTWCPNCYDETKFIKEYLKNNPGKGIDVIGLACERYKDTSQAIRAIKTYKTRMDIPYDILLASTTSRKIESNKQVPFIDSLIAFPTMVILDKSNIIQVIHTGFDGPATSQYESFKKEFDGIISSLLKNQH